MLSQGVGYSVILGFGAFFAVFTSFLVGMPLVGCLSLLFSWDLNYYLLVLLKYTEVYCGHAMGVHF